MYKMRVVCAFVIPLVGATVSPSPGPSSKQGMVVESLHTTNSTAVFGEPGYKLPGIDPGRDYPNITIDEANRTPNDTVSVPFKLGDQSWTFRVNITEVPYPDADGIPNAKLTAATYDLQWPGNEDINETLTNILPPNEEYPRLCTTNIYPQFGFPQEVIHRYEEGSSSCLGPLGESCWNALVKGLSNGSSNPLECPFFRHTAHPKECLGIIPSYTVMSTDLLRLVGGTWKPDSSFVGAEAQRYPQGTSYSYVATGPYDGSNKTVFEVERDRLYMSVITGNHTALPVCARVKSKKGDKTDSSKTSSVAMSSRTSAAAASSDSPDSAGKSLEMGVSSLFAISVAIFSHFI